MNIQTRAVWSVLVLASVCLLNLSSYAEDRVQIRDSKGNVQEVKGVVVGDNLDYIKIRSGGTIQYPAAQVVQVDFDIDNPFWTDGLKYYQQQDWAEAATAFTDLLKDRTWANFREAAKPYLLFLAGSSFRQSKQYDKALKVFETLLMDAKYSSSRHLPLATREFIETAIVLKQFDKVPPALARLRQVGGEMAVVADYCEGTMLIAQGQTQRAEALFVKVAAATKNEETRALANLGRAQCAEKTGNLKAAKDAARRALNDKPTDLVAGTAHLIIGRALLVEAPKVEGDANRQNAFTDAILEFLRVPIAYPDAQTEPEAMFQLGQCHQMLSQFPGRAGESRTARYWYSLLQQKYAASPWAEKAKAEASQLR
jgi:tetratricopeptide (TPR) repeat protein